MINIDTDQFWVSNTPPPPLNDTIGDYDIESELKDPTRYSYIYLGSKQNDNNKKVLKFVKITKSTIYKIKNEIETMNIVHHPNILRLEDYFKYNEYMCLVTPYMPLECLHNFIIERYSKGIPEKMASKIMYQLLNAVNYLHKHNIWHRDIKPDNILVVDNDEKDPKVVLADFGFARKFDDNSLSNEFLGTPEFTAPEIFQMEEYSNKVDIWSLGVSLFVMLAAKYPTCAYSRNPRQCKWLIERGKLNFKLLETLNISADAINFVKKMCTLDPDTRITAEEALNDPWITKNNNIENEIDNVLGAIQKDESDIRN